MLFPSYTCTSIQFPFTSIYMSRNCLFNVFTWRHFEMPFERLLKLVIDFFFIWDRFLFTNKAILSQDNHATTHLNLTEWSAVSNLHKLLENKHSPANLSDWRYISPGDLLLSRWAALLLHTLSHLCTYFWKMKH